MNERAFHFRYFRDPHNFSTYQTEPGICGICERVRSGYGPPFFYAASSSQKKLDFVCEECLATGKLAEKGVSTNTGDQAMLKRLLINQMPDAPDQRLHLFEQYNVELQQRTPFLPSWEPLAWPAHCSDYTEFLKEVGRPELDQLATNRDGLGFLAAHTYPFLLSEGQNTGGQRFLTASFYRKEEVQASELWQTIRLDAPQNNRASSNDQVGIYLFQCLHCQEYLILWDCE